MTTVSQARSLANTQVTIAATQHGRNPFLRTLAVVLITLLTILWMVPLLSAIYMSVRTQADITNYTLLSVPTTLTLQNFPSAWERGRVATYLANSFIITIPALIFTLFLSSLAAFALARYRFKGNLMLYFMFVAGTMLPFQILMLPVFYLASRIGLYNQYGGLIAIHTAFQMGFCTFVLRNFMRTIPGEIIEAARIDGASEWRIYWGIMMPLSLSSLAALATLEFTWIFNDYLWAIVLLSDGSKKPATAGLAALRGQFNTDWPVVAAGALIAAIPTVLIFTFLQRYFIQGLTLGSGK
jgi:multiple sugar transport system permease protein